MRGFIQVYSLDFDILAVEVMGFVCVLWDFESSLLSINEGIDFSKPWVSQDDLFISTVDNVEQDSVYNAIDPDEDGSDELDKSSFIVGSIDISGIDGFWEVMLGEVMSFDKTSVDAVHSCSTINRCSSGDVFSMGVFQNSNCYA